MVQSHIITRITDSNIFRERVWYQCDKCRERFEHYNTLFAPKTTVVECPKCQSKLTKDKIDLLD